MQHEELFQIFDQLHKGDLSPKEALAQVEQKSYQDLGFAKIDHGRGRRQGFPEVVYGETKTPEQLLHICQAHLKVCQQMLITRLSLEKWQYLEKNDIEGHYNPKGRTLAIDQAPKAKVGDILVVTAGTSDLPVAEEARETANIMGSSVEVISDIGVAGVHRLLDRMERIRKARVIIVVAGMEGALASVVGGLVQVPVIAVPTSIGYGASFNGIAALLGMLNSCSPGVTVVNIDNGFGAGFTASLINNPPASQETEERT